MKDINASHIFKGQVLTSMGIELDFYSELYNNWKWKTLFLCHIAVTDR